MVGKALAPVFKDTAHGTVAREDRRLGMSVPHRTASDGIAVRVASRFVAFSPELDDTGLEADPTSICGSDLCGAGGSMNMMMLLGGLSLLRRRFHGPRRVR